MKLLNKLKSDRQDLISNLLDNIESLEKLAFEQKAEIEYLKKVIETMTNNDFRIAIVCKEQIDKMKAENLELLDMCAKQGEEAIKEFAERLKKKSQPTIFCDNSIQKTRNVYYRIEETDIDNLVKEMVGDDNA